MAVEHMALVFESDGLDSAEKLLLLAYANYTDPHGYCWPGVERLAADTGTSKRTVIRTRKALEAKNLLRHQRRTSTEGRQSTNLYRINLTKLREIRRAPTAFDDNALALEFQDNPPPPEPETPKTDSDLPKCQSDTPPWQSDTPEGGNLTPPPWQSDTLSVRDPSEDPSVRTRARENGRTEPNASEVTDNHCEMAWQLVTAADLSQVDAKQSQARQIRDAVATALAAGYSPEAVRVYLRSKLHEAKTVTYVLRAFEPHRLGDIENKAAIQPVPPVCGQCDAQDRDPTSQRTVTDSATGRVGRCPRCHPSALARPTPSTTDTGASSARRRQDHDT